MAETIYTVTEMAKMVGVIDENKTYPSAVKLNLIMRDLGIQTKVNGKWIPKDEYRKYAVLCGLDGKTYYKWRDDLLIVVIKGLGKIVSRQY